MTTTASVRYIAESCEATCNRAVSDWIEIVSDAITQHGLCNVALSGGRTPIFFYHQLLQHANLSRVDWSRVHLFMVDERYVPLDHAESNYRMTCEQLIAHITIPASNLHPVNTSLPLQDAVVDYTKTLETCLPPAASGTPQFDLVMLGMGADGHTASLFPGTSAANEYKVHVVSVISQAAPMTRISITFSVINAARHVMLLVCGKDKASVINHIFGHDAVEKYPVQRVNPEAGSVHWYLDSAAAGPRADSH